MKITIIILQLLVAISINAQTLFSAASDTAAEVGIFEHLGDTLPKGIHFINENDDTVELSSLVNKPTIFTFVYFDCPGICSPLLDGVSDVIEKMDLKLATDYQVITISFNYMDNPEKARQKKRNFMGKHAQTNSGGWLYLTGDSANIHAIVNAVGFKFKEAGLDFIHPGAIMVVSPNGVITRYLYGITFLPFDVKMAIIESQTGQVRPSINRVLEFCYAYDNSAKRYALDIKKVGGIIILTILILFAFVMFFNKNRK